MAIVYADTGDSYVRNTSASSWSGAQGSATTTGNLYNKITGQYNFSPYNIYGAGRGGNTFSCFRSYFPFDLSGETGTVVSCELKIYMDNLGSTASDFDDVTVVKATALADSTADFGNVYTSGTSFGYELVTPITVSQIAAYHTFTLNARGIIEVNSAVGTAGAGGTLTVGLIGDRCDFGGVAPLLGGDYTQIGVHYTDYGSSDRRPYLDITYEAAVADSATFFGTNF